jgi:hypothetical protein
MTRKQERNIMLRMAAAVFLSFLFTGVWSQEEITCADKLKEAQAMFNRGQTEKIAGLLKDCLRAGFKKEEELLAYKLIIQTFILEDKVTRADSAMLSFLKKNPEYQLSTTDHSSFVHLYNSFRVKTLLMMSLRFGTNLSFLSFVNEDPAFGEGSAPSFSSDGVGLWFSLEAKLKATQNLETGVEVALSQSGYSGTLNSAYSVISYAENQYRIDLPLFVNYSVSKGHKLQPYLRAAAGPSVLLSAKATASEDPIERNNPNEREGVEVSRMDSRNKIDLLFQAGAGIRYKVPRGYIFLDTRGSFGLLEQKSGKGDSGAEMLNKYHWSDPYFRLNNFNVNLGYTFIFYKPSKKKI